MQCLFINLCFGNKPEANKLSLKNRVPTIDAKPEQKFEDVRKLICLFSATTASLALMLPFRENKAAQRNLYSCGMKIFYSKMIFYANLIVFHYLIFSQFIKTVAILRLL